MYENKTEYVILNNMLDKVTTDVAKTEGSLIYDALAPVANETAKQYMELDTYIKRSFIQTAWGHFLDIRAVEFGLERKSSTKAAVTLTFTGTTGVVIPQGFGVQTAGGMLFLTTSPIAISGGTAAVAAQAAFAGSSYNVAANLLTTITKPLTGVTSVTNASAASGGTLGETDTDFRARILDTVRNPASSGNVAHYKKWAMETDGVGAAKVIPLWNGNGTVKVCLLNTDRQPASSLTVTTVAAHIEEERPIGASVTVVPGSNRSITLTCSVTLSGTKTLTEATEGIRAAIAQHFYDNAYASSIVSYPQLSSIILDVEGIADHANLLLNGYTSNVTLVPGEVPLLVTLTVTEA